MSDSPKEIPEGQADPFVEGPKGDASVPPLSAEAIMKMRTTQLDGEPDENQDQIWADLEDGLDDV